VKEAQVKAKCEKIKPNCISYFSMAKVRIYEKIVGTSAFALPMKEAH
jgi:hypothetical protein